MHEVSLCQSILAILQEKGAALEAKKIVSVRLEAGSLVAVEPDIMQLAFRAVSKGSLAEGAKLMIEEQQAMGYCANCQQETAIQNYFDGCPLCGQYGLTITQGETLTVLSMEID